MYYSATSKTENLYPNTDVETENKENEIKYLQVIAGQTRVATRDDYENEALYTEMTQHYYVSYI